MFANPTADDLYRWARICVTEAATRLDPVERQRFFRMRDALVGLAADRRLVGGAAAATDEEIQALAKRMVEPDCGTPGQRSGQDPA